jgi:hypothetical protein
MNMKKGDLEPDLVISCRGADGTTPDLTTATSVQVVARLEGASTALFTRNATGDADGNVTMAWQAGDTDTVGRMLIEVRVTWPGSKPEHYPATSYLPIDIMDTLG